LTDERLVLTIQLFLQRELFAFKEGLHFIERGFAASQWSNEDLMHRAAHYPAWSVD